MTVKEIVGEYLKGHEYDGLYCFFCTCPTDNLMRCCNFGGVQNTQYCNAGMKRYCKTCAKGQGCHLYAHKDGFCITRREGG